MSRKVYIGIGLLLVVLLLSGVVFAGPPDHAGDNQGVGEPLTVLVVGYGWYRGIPEGQINNAQLVAEALDGEKIMVRDENGKPVAQANIHGMVVPVTWSGAMPPVYEAIEELDPDIVLGVGTMGGGALRFEPGSNWARGTDANPDDPEDEEYKDELIVPDGPDYYHSNMPYVEMILSVLETGTPAQLGFLREWEDGPIPYRSTAGGYLCNWMAYLLPHYVEVNDLDINVGFVHIPTQPAYRVEGRLAAAQAAETEEELEEILKGNFGAFMDIDRTIEGVRTALETNVRILSQE